MNTDYRIDQSRLLKILEKSQDKSYFYAALLFCKLAEKIWIDEITDFTVLHGYSHIKKVLLNQEDILLKFSDKEIVDFFSEKYIFILLAATYSHDFGMKAYYKDIHSEYNDMDYNELPFSAKIKLRHRHHEIIDTAISKIVDESQFNNFFGKELLKYLDRILLNNPNMSSNVKSVIINNSRKIAIVAKYHNQNLEDLDDLITRLQSFRKLHLSNDEIPILKLVTAILQFSDALDMGISRVDIDKFYHSISNVQDFSFDEFQLIHKSSRSYMIDSIESSYVDEAKKNYKIEFNMSLCEQDLESHYDFVQTIKNEYEKRLKRNDRDCLSIIEDNLNIYTNIVCSEKSVESNNYKYKLPEIFFDIRRHQTKTMGNYLKEIFNNLSERSVLTFFKFYSTNVNVFYGGFCYFHNNSMSQISEEDTKVKTYLERIIFHPLDWQIDIKKEYDYQKISTLKYFGLVNRRHVVDYKEYIKYYKHKRIKSEIHFPLKYKNALLGFVKLHYLSELNDDEVSNELSILDKKLKTFGIEIQNIFTKRIYSDYIKEISNARYLTKKNRTDLISLYSNIFEQYPFPAKDVTFSSIKEIKKVININPIDKDEDSFVMINKNILEDFYKESDKYNHPVLGKSEWSVNMNNSERLVSIQCKLSSTVISSQLVRKEFLQASVYFEDDFPDEISHNYRITRYVIPLKCFVASFGGKIFSELENNNRTLIIKMIFPKFNKKTLPNNV